MQGGLYQINLFWLAVGLQQGGFATNWATPSSFFICRNKTGYAVLIVMQFISFHGIEIHVSFIFKWRGKQQVSERSKVAATAAHQIKFVISLEAPKTQLLEATGLL